ncbi:MAG: hypothetical protein ACTHWU_08565 [Senegalia sp. (in: firmicutes)]|uniref:hypothetical protein n=1 Tax=Senegalia sp. (in: firmicutes) TaxID=1924098 RepID=UPI003F97E94D
MFFETERLYTREFSIKDSEPFIYMQANSAVMRHTTGRTKAEKESMDELVSIIANYKK